MAVLLALVVIFFAASFAYAVWKEPVGGSILLLLLGLLGGLFFLGWIVFRAFGGIIRFVAGPPREKEPRPDYPDHLDRALAARVITQREAALLADAHALVQTAAPPASLEAGFRASEARST